METKKTLILGIGNYLMGDEGIGVHVALEMEKEPLPLHVSLLDGGTGGFHLLEHFENHDRVILIDATLDDREPGSIRLIKPRFVKDFPPAMSTHDIGLKDMISALVLLGTLPEIDLFVVSIATIQQQGTELTPEVAACIPKLKQQIKALIATTNVKAASEAY